MKEIVLGDGSAVIVDANHFEYLAQFKWSAQGNGYAFRRINVDGKYQKIYLHRFIMKAVKGEYVDHINGDKIDNRICNLRICTNAENSRNSKKKTGGSSKYKGVTFEKRTGRWVAQIMLNRKNIFLGSFKTEVEAAIQYNKGAIKYHGEFAKLNEIDEEETA
jgi:hypothetical protein